MAEGDQNPKEAVSKINADLRPVDANIEKYSDLERDFFSLRNEGIRQEIEERKKYARRIFVLCCFWVTAVLLLIVQQGRSQSGFHVSDSVLLAAIGSTTANIISVFVIVAKHLFPDKPEHKS